jgi:hypothetical protein
MEVERLTELNAHSHGPGAGYPLDVHHATAYPHGQIYVLAGSASEFLQVAASDIAHFQAVNRTDGQPDGARTDRVTQILAHDYDVRRYHALQKVMRAAGGKIEALADLSHGHPLGMTDEEFQNVEDPRETVSMVGLDLTSICWHQDSFTLPR